MHQIAGVTATGELGKKPTVAFKTPMTVENNSYAILQKGDGAVIDGLGPNGIAARVVDVTNRVVRLQTGYLYHYAFAMLLGIAALVTWMMLGSSL